MRSQGTFRVGVTGVPQIPAQAVGGAWRARASLGSAWEDATCPSAELWAAMELQTPMAVNIHS